MPNTKITKQKWKDHYSYAKKVYIIGFLVALGVSNLVFSVTRYIPPPERAVQIQLIDNYVDTSKLDDLKPVLLAAGQEFDETLEEVSFLSVAYSGGAMNDPYGIQAYTIQVYAGGNDIFILDDALLTDLVKQNYCLPLETLEGYDEFMRKHPEVQPVWRDEPSEDAESEYEDDIEDDTKPPAVQHVYALDASPMQDFITRNAYSINGKYALITSTSTNPETSFYILTLMYDHLSGAPAATMPEATQ